MPSNALILQKLISRIESEDYLDDAKLDKFLNDKSLELIDSGLIKRDSIEYIYESAHSTQQFQLKQIKGLDNILSAIKSSGYSEFRQTITRSNGEMYTFITDDGFTDLIGYFSSTPE